MKKILIVATIPATLRAFLLPFARHFRDQGWRVDGMACGISACGDCIQEFDHVWDIQWSRNPLDPRNLLKTPQIIQNIVKQEKYDIVHVHTPVAAFVTRYALRNLKKHLHTKVIYTAHGFHFHPGGKPLKNALFLGLEKLAGNWHDCLIVINRDDEQAAKSHRIKSPENICYMPGIGLDTNYYSQDAITETQVEQLRQELKLAPETSLFLSVGELIPRKRPQDVLKAYACLARPDTRLAFAGDGPLMNQMQQLAMQLGIQDQVSFLGVRQDITTLISISVATILASEQEGLPRCVMESISLQTPVIGTAIRGTRDLLADGCGLLVPVGDIEELTKAMAWILDHPEAARIMGQKGRNRIIDYDLRHIIKLHEALYEEGDREEGR
ncbi:glycosyltransferase family 4 protein [Anabaena sp. UHCC 0253]|uniref:glycosyltransferase family 4 protein n=1 Tax=Anabaena sp. UHCC 0253 TaxID=2590019 RepID=UPI001446ED78|nr:glycosyltransferase family 4 protein [Anabaena sp. UHCC 0253]MTJ55112.1 glycosyltransferase family 4 protein [Anabaena sp. UHCC 0253]